MSFTVTPLGCVSGMPKNGLGGSGYLISKGGYNLLIDAGCGVALNLTKVISPKELDALIITHLHIDHVYDALAVIKSVQTSNVTLDENGGISLNAHKKINVLLPQGGEEKLKAFASLYPTVSNNVFDSALETSTEVTEYADGDECALGPFNITLIELAHVVDNCGVRVDDGDATFAFTGDTGPTEKIVELANGVDCLLTECTFPKPINTNHGHLSGIEAGKIAKTAGVKKLFLTHFGSADDEFIQNSEQSASSAFGDYVTAVIPGKPFAVGEKY